MGYMLHISKLWYLGNYVAYRSIPYTPVYPSYPVLRCLVYSRVSVHSVSEVCDSVCVGRDRIHIYGMAAS